MTRQDNFILQKLEAVTPQFGIFCTILIVSEYQSEPFTLYHVYR